MTDPIGTLLLDRIAGRADVRRMTDAEPARLADELRAKVIAVV